MRFKIVSTLLLILLLTLAVPGWCQSGNIPTTVQAERMILLLLNDPTAGSNTLQSIGLSVSDQAVVSSNAASFYSTYTTLVTNFNNSVNSGGSPDPGVMAAARDSAVNTAFSNFQNQMSSQGYSTLTAFVTFSQNNEMFSPGNDLVAVAKFAPGGGWDGGDEWNGSLDDVLLDGNTGGGGQQCHVFSDASDQFIGPNSWSTLSAAPSGTTLLRSAADGTILAVNSAHQLFMFAQNGQSFQQLPGAGIEIDGGAKNQSIYSLGTDGKLYWYNGANNSWYQTNTPLSTISHIAVSNSDGSVFVASGKTVAVYATAPVSAWVTIGNAPVNVGRMTTYFRTNPTGQYQQWSAFFIGSDGHIYSAYYSNYNGGIKSISDYSQYFSGYTGTPTDIHLNADGSILLTTTTGTFFSTGYGAEWIFSPVSGAGSVSSSDSVNSVYSVGSTGNIGRFFPSANTTVTSSSVSAYGAYVSVSNTDILNNLPAIGGYGFTSMSAADVVVVCGTVKDILLHWLFNRNWHMAEEQIKMISLTNEFTCGDETCGNWITTPWCVNVPDLNVIEMTGALNPTPWGWSVFGLVWSVDGHRPWNTFLDTAIDPIPFLFRYPQGDPQQKAVCTSTP